MNATEIAGVLVSDDTINALRAARVAGKEAMFWYGQRQPGRCSNCGGVGTVTVCLWPARPGAEQTAAVTWHDGKLRTVEMQPFACPLCASDRPTKLELLARQSGLTDAERRWRLDYYAGMEGKTNAVAACGELLALAPRPAGWLTLYGPYGVGKSGMLKSLVACFCAAGVSAAYIVANDILVGLRSTYNDKADVGEAELLARWGSYQCLAVDEIDRVGDSAWARSMLFGLLNNRYDHRDTRATLIATNLRPDMLPPEFGYLASRMTDGERIPVGGQALRGVTQ